MKGQLILMNNINFVDEIIEIETSKQNGFDIYLYIDDKKSVEKQLVSKEIVIDTLDKKIEILKSFDFEMDEEEIKTYNIIKENVDNIYENIEYVKLRLDNVDEKEFIDNNSIIQNKKIIISEYISISDYDKIIKLLEKYDKYKENIYVFMEGNKYNAVSLSDCFETINKIKKQANDILLLNLSPLETIMYTYDQVRNRVYKRELEGDSASVSRDLSNVLNSEEIVCVGYSSIFSALLNYMNIKCYNVVLNDKDDEYSGHERNLIYVKDNKYKIDGVYYFDVTWDSKRKNETNQFLNRYKYFARTRNEMVDLEDDCFNYKYFEYYSEDMLLNKDKTLDELSKNFSSNLITNRFLAEKKLGFLLNHMIERIGKPDLKINDIEELENKDKEKEIQKVIEKYNKPISAETYIELLNNVRKVEYEQNPEFYPYSIEKIYETYVRSEWTFKNHYYDPQERLLISIFGEKSIEDRDDEKNDFVQFIHEKNIYNEINKITKAKNKK